MSDDDSSLRSAYSQSLTAACTLATTHHPVTLQDVAWELLIHTRVVPPLEQALLKHRQPEQQSWEGCLLEAFYHGYLSDRKDCVSVSARAFENAFALAPSAEAKYAVVTALACLGYFHRDLSVMDAAVPRGYGLARKLGVNPLRITMTKAMSIRLRGGAARSFLERHLPIRMVDEQDPVAVIKYLGLRAELDIDVYGKTGSHQALLAAYEDLKWRKELVDGIVKRVGHRLDHDINVSEYEAIGAWVAMKLGKWTGFPTRNHDRLLSGLSPEHREAHCWMTRFEEVTSQPCHVRVSRNAVVFPIVRVQMLARQTGDPAVEELVDPEYFDARKALSEDDPHRDLLAAGVPPVGTAGPKVRNARLLALKRAFYRCSNNPNVQCRLLKMFLAECAKNPDFAEACPGVSALITEISARRREFIPSIDDDEIWPVYPRLDVALPETEMLPASQVISFADVVVGRMNDLVHKAERALAQRAFKAHGNNITRASEQIHCDKGDLSWLLKSADAIPGMPGRVLWQLGENATTLKDVRREVKQVLAGLFPDQTNGWIGRFFFTDVDRINRIRNGRGAGEEAAE